jgi:hypothetical protein
MEVINKEDYIHYNRLNEISGIQQTKRNEQTLFVSWLEQITSKSTFQTAEQI